MSSYEPAPAQKPREHRRRVVLPARLRHGVSWSDACILNISSRGLMIHTGREIQSGTQVELRRGECVIVARVVWCDGGRTGLRSEDRVPFKEIMTLRRTPTLQLAADQGERRKHPRSEARSRLRARAIEFASVAIIAVSLAGAALTMVESAIAHPMVLVRAALAE